MTVHDFLMKEPQYGTVKPGNLSNEDAQLQSATSTDITSACMKRDADADETLELLRQLTKGKPPKFGSHTKQAAAALLAGRESDHLLTLPEQDIGSCRSLVSCPLEASVRVFHRSSPSLTRVCLSHAVNAVCQIRGNSSHEAVVSPLDGFTAFFPPRLVMAKMMNGVKVTEAKDKTAIVLSRTVGTVLRDQLLMNRDSVWTSRTSSERRKMVLSLGQPVLVGTSTPGVPAVEARAKPHPALAISDSRSEAVGL